MQAMTDGIPLDSLFLHSREKFRGAYSAAEINHKNSDASREKVGFLNILMN